MRPLPKRSLLVEKYVLREAVKDVITDAVYKRQKHPFLSPPATLNPDDSFQTFVQDMLRGETMRALPFFCQREVIALLDRLPGMEVGERTAFDQILMYLVSLCVLQERFGLESGVAYEAASFQALPASRGAFKA